MKNKVPYLVGLGLLGIFGMFAIAIAFFSSSTQVQASPTTRVSAMGNIALSPGMSELLVKAFPEVTDIIIAPAGDATASIQDVLGVKTVYLPTEEALQDTYLSEVVATKGVQTAHEAILLQLVSEYSSSGGSLPIIAYGDMATMQRLELALSAGVDRLEGEALAERLETVSWMLAYYRNTELTAQAIAELGDANERLSETNLALIADQQHQRETWASEADASRNDLLVLAGMYEGGDTIQTIFLSLVMIAALGFAALLVVWIIRRGRTNHYVRQIDY